MVAGSGANPIPLTCSSHLAEASAKNGGALMGFLELRDIAKTYGVGPTEVRALQNVFCPSNPANWWRSWERADQARARF